MDSAAGRHARSKIERLAKSGLDWVTLSAGASEAMQEAVPFTRTCWHTVDPGTVLFTGSLNRDIECSGTWLAHHEYVIEDVNKWWFLARSGRRAGATSLATHGDLSRCARHRTQEAYGVGDELRGAFVVDDVYWGAAGFLREEGQPWFTEEERRFLVSLCEPLANGFRRAMLLATIVDQEPNDMAPGVVIFDGSGGPEYISPTAERWIHDMVEEPAPTHAVDSRIVQLVAARARALEVGQDPLGLAARSRVQTRSGTWLLLYGTPLAGGAENRIAVIIQPAPASEIAPLVALAYGLTDRECRVTQLCMQGQSTKQMAQVLNVSAYTVQDHLKSIFAKTGVRTRGELVGQVFLEHYIPRWESVAGKPAGWGVLLDTAKVAEVPQASTGSALSAAQMETI